VTLRSDPTASAVVSFGREGGVLFVDPYRGTVLGELSPVHDFLHEVVEWHRWLGSRDMGRPITGVANLGFLGLVLLGVYLWWPRRWAARGVVPAVALRRRAARARPRLQLAQRDRHLVRARAARSDPHRARDVLPVGQPSALHADRQRGSTAGRAPGAACPRGPGGQSTGG